MKQNGFTLIELLAVIILLGLIIMIAYPIITNVILSAEKSAMEDSAYGYIRSVETSVTPTIFNYNGEYDIIDKTIVNKDDGTIVDIDYNGNIASGELTIKNKVVKSAELHIEDYVLEYDGKEVRVTNR